MFMDSRMAEMLAAFSFPVYGIVGEPLDLRCNSYWSCIGLPAFEVHYRSARYPVCTAGKIILCSFYLRSQEAGRVSLHWRDIVIERVIAAQEQPVREPFRWEGSLPIAGTLFSGIITYYAAPLFISDFRLTSEKTLISGHACGPNVDELVQLLEGLQVLSATSLFEVSLDWYEVTMDG
jgi:hypothetical protein